MVKDKEKRDGLIEGNLRLVHSICKRFCGKGIEYDDLYQAGCIGLIKAADAFDEERGLCFSTYAVPVIMGEVRRLFRDGGTVKVSRSIKELAMAVTRESQRMSFKLDREPTVSEIANSLGVTPEDVTEAICATQPTVSLTYEGDDGIKEIDLPYTSTEEEITNRLILDEAFSKLEEVERKIVICRYYKYMTQSKTAEVLGMSQVQISRAEKKILQKLRIFLE